MKKVKLKALDLGASELLSREEQSILFGSGGSGGSGDPCSVSLKCAYGGISCSDPNGDCGFIFGDPEHPHFVTGIYCGSKTYCCTTGSAGNDCGGGSGSGS